MFVTLGILLIELVSRRLAFQLLSWPEGEVSKAGGVQICQIQFAISARQSGKERCPSLWPRGSFAVPGKAAGLPWRRTWWPLLVRF